MTSTIKSADRVMDVLQFLATRVRPVRTMMIARHCDLPKSSAYHLLNRMKERNFVIYYPEERAWGLGPSVFEIGGAYLRSEPLSWLGRPVIQELADACNMTAHLAVLHGADVLYILKEAPRGSATPQLVSRVGLRLPAHLTAVGRAILMWLPREHLRALLPVTSPLIKRTRRGPDLLSELECDLANGREHGYTIERGMTTPGITCLASTVFSHEGRAIAGLGVTFVQNQGEQPDTDQLAAHVVRAASSLSLALGGRHGVVSQNGGPHRMHHAGGDNEARAEPASTSPAPA
jgi:IclR family transcriptional regulator, acetate operon repressor